MFVVLLTSILNVSNLAKWISLNNQQCMDQPTLLIYTLMNNVKDYITIHLQLIQTDVLEVAILLMVYLLEYVFQTKQKIWTWIFSIWFQE